MKTHWISMIRNGRGGFLFHPADSVLQAYQDGALDDRQVGIMVRHLQDCPRCRQKSAEQTEALQWFLTQEHHLRPQPTQVAPEGLQRLEKAIQTNVTGPSGSRPLTSEIASFHEVVKERILSELQLYLGRATMQDLIGQVEDPFEETHTVLFRAEPMLTTFLGKKAMVNICSKISAARTGI